jgi:adenosylcobinamide-phosphate synthase
MGPQARGADIGRAWKLVMRTTLLWVVAALALAALLSLPLWGEAGHA